MEYDRTLKEKGCYRTFLFTTAQRKEVVPLDAAIVAECCHDNNDDDRASLSAAAAAFTAASVAELRMACTLLFRLKYTKEVLLHPKIDDTGITAIGSMISFTSHEICIQVS